VGEAIDKTEPKDAEIPEHRKTRTEGLDYYVGSRDVEYICISYIYKSRNSTGALHCSSTLDYIF